MTTLMRVRLTQLPTARDLEYLVLRYLKVDGVYDVPLHVAHDLIEFGCALPCDSAEPLTDLDDRLPCDYEDD